MLMGRRENGKRRRVIGLPILNDLFLLVREWFGVRQYFLKFLLELKPNATQKNETVKFI